MRLRTRLPYYHHIRHESYMIHEHDTAHLQRRYKLVEKRIMRTMNIRRSYQQLRRAYRSGVVPTSVRKSRMKCAWS